MAYIFSNGNNVWLFVYYFFSIKWNEVKNLKVNHVFKLLIVLLFLMISISAVSANGDINDTIAVENV